MNLTGRHEGGEAEIPLQGGRTTAGIVRVGHTVRRPPTPNSEFVRRLLDHLHDVGFDGAPWASAPDESGRDTLEFIVGEVPTDLSIHEDHVLREAARLIRRFHDATVSLVMTSGPSDVEVVCHNDLSPCNFVFVSGIPKAIIDFDAASPGTRVQDLAYAAWLWLDLGVPDQPASEQARRLTLFLAAYGEWGAAQTPIVDAILSRQAAASVRGLQIEDLAMATWALSCRDWTIHHRAALETEP